MRRKDGGSSRGRSEDGKSTEKQRKGQRMIELSEDFLREHPSLKYPYENQKEPFFQQLLSQKICGEKYRVVHTYKPVTQCQSCGSENIVYRSIFVPPATQILMIACDDCGKTTAAASIENLRKRTSNELAKWSKAVISRDGGKCVICGSSKNPEAHHIIPVASDKNMEYKFRLSNGITLCKECHNKVHPYKEKRYEATASSTADVFGERSVSVKE